MLLLTLRGTPTVYYGDELGLSRVAVPREAVQDPWELNEPGQGRDPSRTPMQWDTSENAGFTHAPRPWLPLSADWKTRNVATLVHEQGSMLCLYRELIALRRAHLALNIGTLRILHTSDDVLVYRRSCHSQHIVVALNFSDEEATLPPECVNGELLLSTHVGRNETPPAPTLRPNEGIVVKVG
jgi:alpha-glucosidase